MKKLVTDDFSSHQVSRTMITIIFLIWGKYIIVISLKKTEI